MSFMMIYDWLHSCLANFFQVVLASSAQYMERGLFLQASCSKIDIFGLFPVSDVCRNLRCKPNNSA